MPIIWASTLAKLPQKLDLDPALYQTKFQRFNQTRLNKLDSHLTITQSEMNWINFACSLIHYPQCQCGKSLCGDSSREVCTCENNSYQAEYLLLKQDIDAAELAYSALVNAPFRQSRNAFGFAASIFGGINFFITNILPLSTAATCFAFTAPPAVLFGGFVYLRGRREEQKINADYQADLIEKKINLLCKHQKAVIQRCQNPLLQNNGDQIPFLQTLSEPTKPKPEKEKRDILGNPISHFIVGSLSTLAITYVVIKWGMLAPLVVAGGPIAWIIAAAMGIAVGSYFAYKRYNYLVAKKQLDAHIAVINAKDEDLQKILEKTVPITPEQPSTAQGTRLPNAYLKHSLLKNHKKSRSLDSLAANGKLHLL